VRKTADESGEDLTPEVSRWPSAGIVQPQIFKETERQADRAAVEAWRSLAEAENVEAENAEANVLRARVFWTESDNHESGNHDSAQRSPSHF